jgi:hypothetical protein
MKRRPRRNHTPAFKAKVAIAAIQGDRTLAHLRSSSTSIPTRSRPGKRSSKPERPIFWSRRRESRRAGRGCESATRQDRRTDFGN